jgi:hypothetical protein
MLTPDADKVFVPDAYDRKHAEAVVEAAIADYRDQFGE